MLPGELAFLTILFTPLDITSQPLSRIHGIIRIDRVDIHRDAVYLQSVLIEDIEKSIFLHTLTTIFEQDIEVTALLGFTSGPAADNGHLLHINVFTREVFCQFLIHIVLDHLLDLILRIVLQSLNLRAKFQRIHTVQQVIEHAVGHLFLIGVLDMQEVGNGIPELAQYCRDLFEDASGILLVSHELLQALGATLATILSQSLGSNLIIRMQIGVLALDIIPHLRRVFHHLDDLFPLFRILLAQDFGPQVGIFVDGRLYRGHIGVKIDLSLMDKAIDLTFYVTEQDGFPALVGLILILLKDALTFGSIEIHVDARTTHTLNQGVTQP